MTQWQRTLYIMVFVQFVSAVGFSSTFPFLTLYIEELGSSTGMNLELLTGLVFSAQPLAQMLVSPIWGSLADRRGRKLMVVRATIGGGLTIFAMAFARSGEDMIVLRVVQGLIAGVLSAATALVAANVPRDRVGYSLGLLQVGLWGGVSVGPLIGGVVADAFGFRVAFAVTASLLIVGGLMVAFGINERFTPPPRPTGNRSGFLSSWGHVLSMPGVRLTYIADFTNQLGRSMLMPFIPLYIKLLVSDSSGVATITGIVSGVSAFTGTLGAVYMGRLGDRIGPRRVLIGGAAVAALFYLPQAIVSGIWQLLILQAITGAVAGGLMPAISALLARTTEPGQEGAVYGLENSIMASARSIAPMIGSLVVVWLELRSVFALTAVIYVLMAFVVFRWMPRTRAVEGAEV